MSKFNIGDLVKIGTLTGSRYVVNAMYKFEGRVGRIIERHLELDFQHLVKIEGTDGWWFDENILTPFFALSSSSSFSIFFFKSFPSFILSVSFLFIALFSNILLTLYA